MILDSSYYNVNPTDSEKERCIRQAMLTKTCRAKRPISAENGVL